jgi:2,4-dienoyl-CoA reductase-like NADH-dependent reductase (Old Yellow Enzyme family)/thioredoxin reductase
MGKKPLKSAPKKGRGSNRFGALFEAGEFGGLKTKNRLMMAPMVLNYADEEGRVTDRYAAHIERIAAGGVGTVIVEASYVRPDGKVFERQLGLHDDTVVTGLSRLVQAAHDEGAVIGIQLNHGGRQASQEVSGFEPVAPSAVADSTLGEKPRALRVAEIKDVVRAFGDAAERAKRAGFDFIELHGAHGNLIAQFLSSFANRRRDGYGGSPERRLRFLEEVYAEVRRRVGEAFPVTLRLSADERVADGLTPKEAIAVIRRLSLAGLAAAHVSSSNSSSYEQGFMVPPMAVPDAPLRKLAARVKRAVNIPVVAVGKIREPGLAAEMLRDGDADFIALGRSLLADAAWPKKAAAGEAKAIRPCIACNQGCVSRLLEQRDVWCTVNPETGFERDFAAPAADRPRRVLVVGAGPAGLTAAITAAERGHEVTLIEKERKLGGQLVAAGAAPHRGDWLTFREWLMRRVKELGVAVHLGTAFDGARARIGTPDAIIMAVGSSSDRSELPGVDLPHVTTAREVFTGEFKPRGRVLIAGGGCMGAQAAEYLADRGHEVTLVEAGSEVAFEVPWAERELLLARLAKRKVKVLDNTWLESIDEQDVTVRTGETIRQLSADTVVLCLGAKPNDVIVAEMEGIAPRTVVIGDALEPRRVTEAVREAAAAVLGLR